MYKTPPGGGSIASSRSIGHWLGAYRTNALYSGHIFVRFNDLEDVFTRIVLSFYCLDLNHLVRVFYLFMFS